MLDQLVLKSMDVFVERSDEPTILGRFVQSGGDLGAFTFGNDNLLREFEKHLDPEVIKRVNVDRIPLDCNKTYRDFQNDNEELILNQAFHSAKTLEKFLALSNFEAKRKTVVARSSAICSLMLPIFFLQAAQSRRLTFRKNGNVVYIQADANYNRVRGIPFDCPYPISAELITQENVFAREEEPSLGDNSVYRVIQHSLGEVDLIVSKEHDAVDENDEPIEIRGVLHGMRISLSKIVFKSLFLGATQKAIINRCHGKFLTDIHFIDNLKVLDNQNRLAMYKKKTREVLEFLFKFIEETDCDSGEILSCEAGIVVKEGTQGDHRRYSIFNKNHPKTFELYDGWTKPRVYFMGYQKPRVPLIDPEILRGPGYKRPCIYYYHTQEDTELTVQSECFVFAQNCMPKWDQRRCYYPLCDELDSSQFVMFLESIYPGVLELKTRKPAFCTSPCYFDCYVTDAHRFRLVRNIPWTHADGEMNYIVVSGGIDYLCQILSLHRWMSEERKSVPLRFTVIALDEFPSNKEHIRQTMSALGEFTEENLIIHCFIGVIQKGYEITVDALNLNHVTMSLMKPVVCVSPSNFRLHAKFFQEIRGNPWCLHEKKMNYIVFYGGLDHLQHILSLHKWLRYEKDNSTKTAGLTVISMNTLLHTNAIEDVVRLFEKTQNCVIQLEVISLTPNPSEYQPVLSRFFGYQFDTPRNHNLQVEAAISHKLFIVGEIGKVREKHQNFDAQLVRDFVDNGLMETRKCPTKIEVVANKKEIEVVKAKYEELGLSIPISFYGPY